MHENRNLFLFLIEINNAPHQTHFNNAQDLYLAPERRRDWDSWSDGIPDETKTTTLIATL